MGHKGQHYLAPAPFRARRRLLTLLFYNLCPFEDGSKTFDYRGHSNLLPYIIYAWNHKSQNLVISVGHKRQHDLAPFRARRRLLTLLFHNLCPFSDDSKTFD